MTDLLSYVESREREMLNFLARLVNMDSGTLDKTEVDLVGQVLAERLSSLGFSLERVPQSDYGDHIVARKSGTTGRRMMFVGHMDTVFPTGTVAARPFRVEGERAFGPGVLDMKGGLTCLLFALHALRETRRQLFDAVPMVVVLNSDEEMLSPTSTPTIEAEARQADAVCVFEPARPGGELVIARKGVGKYRLTVHGRAAHAGSQPERGRSAILEMAHKIVALHGLTDPDTGVTVNVGVVCGGERSNVIADRAEAEIDLRVPTMEAAVLTEQRMLAIAATSTVPGTSARMEGALAFPPMEKTEDAATLFETLREAGRQLGLDLQGVATGGGSDANHTAQYAPTLDGMGPRGSDAHSEREYIEVASLVERTKLIALFLTLWATSEPRTANR